jgi:hypothetical protein
MPRGVEQAVADVGRNGGQEPAVGDDRLEQLGGGAEARLEPVGRGRRGNLMGRFHGGGKANEAYGYRKRSSAAGSFPVSTARFRVTFSAGQSHQAAA